MPRNRILRQETYAEITNNTNDIRDKCNLYLVYLIEKGFRIEVKYFKDYFYSISLYNKQDRRITKIPFEWSDIKLDFIPFLNAINQEYKITGGDLSFYGDTNRSIPTQRVLDDMIINNLKIKSIDFLICIE